MNELEQDFFGPENKRAMNLVLLLVALLSLMFLSSLYASRGIRINKQGELVKEFVDPFANVSIVGKAAIVFDVKSGKVLYQKNADEVLPLASITKIMTAVTALDLLPNYTVITINKEFLKEEGDSGFYRDEKWKLRDLLDFSLVTSSNDGVAAIASAAGAVGSGTKDLDIGREEFIAKMNAKALVIGIPDAHFFNESGLDVSATQSGGYASARDVAKLFSYALKNRPEIFEATRYKNTTVTSLDKITHPAKNTNESIDDLPGVVGSKTGFTNLAGGNLAVIFDPGLARPVVIAVLGSTAEGRFSDVTLLAQKALEAIAQNK
jgi:D-alanyl-D-alanine carboxypeptidase